MDDFRFREEMGLPAFFMGLPAPVVVFVEDEIFFIFQADIFHAGAANHQGGADDPIDFPHG